jgi:hypothetical protein
MANPGNYRRPAFIHRPWITGGLYDMLASKSVLHCDAYVYEAREVAVGCMLFVVDWTEGGRRAVARDVYLIESDELTPVWSPAEHMLPVYWTSANHGLMRRIHATALRMVETMALDYSAVSFLAHYVHVEDSDPWRGPNNYRFKVRVAGK